MSKFAGGALRIFQTFLYVLAFCCSAVILALYSYFLAALTDRHLAISQWKKAVEGISGVGVVYTIFAVVLTCCLGGVPFFAFVALVLDILFVAAFIALAILTRDGASSCNGYVKTPLGNGDANSHTPTSGVNAGDGSKVNITPTLHTACRMNTVCFAVAIIGAFVFAITALMQIALARHQKKEKRFGPSPANNYTSGSGRRRWFASTNRRNRNMDKEADAGVMAPAPVAASGGLAADHSANMRPSHDTAFTSSTVGGSPALAMDHHKHNNLNAGHATYHNQPTNTGLNPYGYDRTTGTASNF